eukprot:g38281.t1
MDVKYSILNRLQEMEILYKKEKEEADLLLEQQRLVRTFDSMLTNEIVTGWCLGLDLKSNSTEELILLFMLQESFGNWEMVAKWYYRRADNPETQ